MDRTEFEELIRETLAEIAPNFCLEEDENGQLIILTGLIEDADNEELVLFDQEENDDYDPEAELAD